ncbi:MAG TPA: peptide chain release factor 2 [Bryobacteraceae bacterium]|nr:peptide chain release factor 2 [Bryobacteraceae bacterium]HOQ45805.1 peptide chain release factor 2 [Bryobacteraceae bacterium]HPQ15779.1 peptide chain release factor 2 [Bryobacteraceae bacterium]HPU70986.1 peptide chain release factor 2 [Bryobacteraceae bacterium]
MIIEDLEREYSALREQAEALRSYLDAPQKKSQLAQIEAKVSAPDFWNQPDQSLLRERKRLEEALADEARVAAALSDLDTLFELAREGEDVSAEIRQEMEKLSRELEKLETEMLLSGENDFRSAIVVIHPGAGGTESQDWAEMLLRMYLRWAERMGFSTVVTDRQEGEGAGIKSVTFEVNGENAYGLLRSEVGVHRLVRISPFDSNARRHTSFASVFVYPQVDDEIKIEIRPEDIRVDTFRAGGRGGQHVNRTDSAVRIVHLPTNIVVQCQNERSQHKNREMAMRQLRARLYEFELEKKRAEERKVEASKADINFGSQIRSYVLAPYRLIKDHRTKLGVGDVDRVLDGDLDAFIHAWLVYQRTGKTAGDGKEDLPE